MTQDSWNEAIEELQRRGWTVTPPDPDPPEKTCSACGKTDSQARDEDGVPLTDVAVTAAWGEEGHVVVTRLYCDADLVDVADALTSLGFTSHRHGGANLLEDRECPGARDMEACPVLTVEEMYTADR